MRWIGSYSIFILFAKQRSSYVSLKREMVKIFIFDYVSRETGMKLKIGDVNSKFSIIKIYIGASLPIFFSFSKQCFDIFIQRDKFYFFPTSP